jgi:hypothetical protein
MEPTVAKTGFTVLALFLEFLGCLMLQVKEQQRHFVTTKTT